MFKRGLSISLKINCIKCKPKPKTMSKWQEATQQEHLDYLEVQQASGKNPCNIKDGVLQTLHKKQTSKPNQTQYWKAKGPDAMEVNTGISNGETREESMIFEGGPTHKKLMDEERATLKLLGLCYFCRGGKHLSANCLEKPPQ
jgi:hypothetical protein